MISFEMKLAGFRVGGGAIVTAVAGSNTGEQGPLSTVIQQEAVSKQSSSTSVNAHWCLNAVCVQETIVASLKW